jgi:hypothetical protein
MSICSGALRAPSDIDEGSEPCAPPSQFRKIKSEKAERRAQNSSLYGLRFWVRRSRAHETKSVKDLNSEPSTAVAEGNREWYPIRILCDGIRFRCEYVNVLTGSKNYEKSATMVAHSFSGDCEFWIGDDRDNALIFQPPDDSA